MQDDEIARVFDDLQDKVLALGDRVGGMLIRSAGLLQHPGLEGQEWLGEEVRNARQLRLAIEMRCLALVAAKGPDAGSRRNPTILIEIASDLELIGEHAWQIGRADYAALDGCYGDSLISIHHLVGVVGSMLRQAVWAAAQRDEAAAQGVLARAAETASLYETAHEELRGLMQRQPRSVSQAVHLAHSVNQLGLAAEKVVSICEWVLFEIRGGTDATPNV